ncbi:hypothetical protein KUCAC02_010938 [Chaenocephalus aceratus]|uniref:Uncharacterized protein n=1 Tax=Chaenocephalus aceratus TaxID=36190 RepID=A0ACB9WVW5_CHAAC|nr:hypothetical protein KUCAC02_010938 [Chaenocephalus aceratus]
MEEHCDLAEDLDCPSLLCEELEDLETKNHQGRRREGEERVFNQTEDDEAGEETGREHEEREEERKRKDVDLENELMATEEEEQVRPESRLGAEEEQMEDDKIENNKETIADKQEAKETKSLEEKNEKKKGRKRCGRKPSERVRNRRGYKDVSERYEEESRIQEASAMSSEESSAPAEPPIGLMNSCDLSDPAFLGCGGAGLHSLQGPQPDEMEINRVYSTRHSIRYSSRGRGLSLPLLPGVEVVDNGLLPPPPKKKTRTLYSTEKRKVIAASVGVTPQRIMVWFQNRRAKWRKVERSITARGEHRQSRAGSSSSPLHHPINPSLEPNSKEVPCFSNHFATKLPQFAPEAPSFSAISNQTPPSYSNLMASLNSPGQSRGTDVGQHQLLSQGGLAEYHPRPMHSPPPLRRASLPLFTTTYNAANPAPPLLNTLAHNQPLFLDALESGSSQALQTDTSSLFDFGDKLDYLTSGQQINPLSYQLQTSYPSTQPQHQPQSAGQILLQSAGHPGGIPAYQSYPWGSMYSQPALHQRSQCPPTYPASRGARDPQLPSSNTLPPPSYFIREDHAVPSHANSQRSSHTSSSSCTMVLPPVSTLRPSRLRAEITPTKAASLLSSQVSPASPDSSPVPPCVKIEYDSPREIHSHFHCDFSLNNF